MTKKSQLWYVASPISMYNDPLYEYMQSILPDIVKKITGKDDCTLAYARGMYPDSKSWLRKWPNFCKNNVTGGIFFFTDRDSYIGKGVWEELIDVLNKGLVAYLVLPTGSYYPIQKTEYAVVGAMIEENEHNWKQYRRVRILPCILCDLPSSSLCEHCHDCLCERCLEEHTLKCGIEAANKSQEELLF